MMQAEDLHVGNLLQMGFSKRPNRTPQYAHGPEGITRRAITFWPQGRRILAPTFSVTRLPWESSRRSIFPEHYLIYRLFFEEARRQGALSGYAHWAFGHLDQTEFLYQQ